MLFYYLNGRFLIPEDCKISILDRGFKFGDAIFETISFENNKFLLLDEHLLRLKNGLLELEIHYDIDNLQSILRKLLAKNTINKGAVRITISRGENSLGYLPESLNKANIAIEIRASTIINYSPKDIIISSYIKPNFKHYPTHLKTAQGLNSTLAIIEAQKLGFFDCLLLNDDNYIAESSSANILFVKSNILLTPSISSAILPGIIRNYILKNTMLTSKECNMSLTDLIGSEYAFLTNSNYKIMPVANIYNQNNEILFSSKDDISKVKIEELIGLDFT
ncbi:MAG: hypothetical protein HOM96_03020 [Rickettsiales bacterium]|jgi:branched-subunit amino acid aminotransferase/4-amino-4-deoxychorismate lyase|nr:hypothetical protein [Rickettsiales bacterium]